MAVFTWSLSGNYPVGGNRWNGQPLALPPAGTWFTPDTKPDAEELNWMFGTIAVNLGNLQPTVATIASGSPTTVTVPANCQWIEIDGCGGGGGGGGGSGADENTGGFPFDWLGGGGGAGAQRRRALLPVTPGAQYDVYVGAGGTAGAGGTGSTTTAGVVLGSQGGDGGATYITPHGVPGTVLVSFPGGAGGGGGGRGAGGTPVSGSGGGNPAVAPGGIGPAGACRNGPVSYVAASSTTDPIGPMRHGDGGASVAPGGATGATSYAGAESDYFAGGTFGAHGVNYGTGSTEAMGGCGGGGGGGGGFGIGGYGGQAGGSAFSGGGGGAVGQYGLPNTGAGGGGGGAGGQSPGSSGVSGGLGGHGGAGGSGYCIIYYVPAGG